MRESNGGKTVGITLRLDKDLLAAYEQIALQANEIRVKRGKRGDHSAQDVMRNVLASHPAAKAILEAAKVAGDQVGSEREGEAQ